jgi:S-adenosylmethionine decarboxylase
MRPLVDAIRDGFASKATSDRNEGQLDHIVEKDGMQFAGTHLLVELWGAERLDDLANVESALRGAAIATGATILHVSLHHFSLNGGISGVVVLSESHITIHTWPERHYAALDVFVCGCCDPYLALPVLREHFAPAHVQLSEQRRGLIA